MRGSTIQQPLVDIVGISNRLVGPRIPHSVRIHLLLRKSSLKVGKLSTPLGTVALNTTDLTFSKVWPLSLVVVIASHLLRLVPLTVGTLVRSLILGLVVIVAAVLVGVIVALLSNIYRDGSRSKDRLRGVKQLGFMIEKALMELCDGGRDISAFDLIHDGFVVIRKPLENEINLIFMVHWFAEDGKLIKTSRYALKVDINGFALFLPVLELGFELLDVPATRFCICGCKCNPGLMSRCCTGDKRLERGRDGSNEGAVDQSILTFPEGIGRVDRDLIFHGKGGCWNDRGSINMAR